MCIKKRGIKCAKKDNISDFNQQLACGAPVRWWKCTTDRKKGGYIYCAMLKIFILCTKFYWVYLKILLQNKSVLSQKYIQKDVLYTSKNKLHLCSSAETPSVSSNFKLNFLNECFDDMNICSAATEK